MAKHRHDPYTYTWTMPALHLPRTGAASFVYIARDRLGAVLYVGVTDTLLERLGRHSRSAAWWSQVDQLSVFEFADRRDANRYETAQIIALRPTHNIHGMCGPLTVAA